MSENPTIEMMPASALTPYRQNARAHSRKQLRQIADSIRRFGFTNPVLVSDDLEIVAGHGRVEAAKMLGLAAVPAVRLAHMSAEERRAYHTGPASRRGSRGFVCCRTGIRSRRRRS